jgi:hypothetical protein
MKPKFMGLAIVLATSAALSLGQMSTTGDAGLLGDRGGLFGLGLLSSAQCGGGGGLGAYNSCGGGGGGLGAFGPQVQYAPPTVTIPTYNVNCPNGVCTMGADGRVLAWRPHPVPAGLDVRPGERYVAGSLRAASSPAPALMAQRRPETRPIARNAGDAKAAARSVEYVSAETGVRMLPKGTTPAEKAANRDKIAKANAGKDIRIVQFTSSKCGVACVQAKKEVERSGVEVEVVEIYSEPGRAIEEWASTANLRAGDFKYAIATPGWIVYDGDKPIASHTGVIVAEDIRATAGLETPDQPDEVFVDEPEAPKAAPVKEEEVEIAGDAPAGDLETLAQLLAELKAQRVERARIEQEVMMNVTAEMQRLIAAERR